MLDNRDIDGVIAALEGQFAERLSPWEVDFVASIAEQWDERGTLTEKQREKLEQIFDRFARGG